MSIVDAPAPFEHETSSEAMWRNLAGLMRTIGGLGRGEVPYSELEPGDMIRLAGDWVTIEVTRPEVMLVVDEDGTRSWYPVDDGETFLRGAL